MWGHACAVVAVTPLAQTAVATALLFWPWMLLWLPAVLLPFIIAQWTSVRAREVSWGPIDIVAAAARRQGLTRDGWSWPLIMLRALMLLLAVIAAARPLLGRPALPEIVVERIAAGTGRGPSARRILLVEPDRPTGSRPAAAAAASAVRPALLALAQAGGFTPPGEATSRAAERRATIPAIAAIASRDLAAALAEQGSPPERSLVVLTDGAAPLDAGAVDGAVARLEQAVKGGGSLLVLLGPQTVSATGQSAFLSWLEACCGVSVGAPARGAGARLEVDAALAAPDRRTAPDDFVVLNGPTIDTVARVSQTARDTAGHSDPTVLARTVPAGDPLIVECSVGRGQVCIVAIPCALPGPDAWSDLSIWPGFVPLIDGLTTRLLETAATAGSSEDEAALGSTPRRSESRWWAALPPARLLLAAAIMLAILDPVVSALLSHRGARTAAPLIPSGGIGRLFRPTIPVVLLALLLGAGRTPMDQADARRDVALLIDVSPSMATEDAHALTDRTASISRLRAVREGLTTPAAGRALATLRAANRDLSITTVGDEFLPLDAADLPNLAPLAPRPNASRLGDAVIRAGTRSGAPPAAIVIASDGAITQGANWAEAARAVAAHDIPLIAIPVGDRGTTGSAAGITIVVNIAATCVGTDPRHGSVLRDVWHQGARRRQQQARRAGSGGAAAGAGQHAAPDVTQRGRHVAGWRGPRAGGGTGKRCGQ